MASRGKNHIDKELNINAANLLQTDQLEAVEAAATFIHTKDILMTKQIAHSEKLDFQLE